MLLIARICLKCLESWSSKDCHINSFVLSLKLFLFTFICYDKQSNFGSFTDQTFTPNGKLHFILEVCSLVQGRELSPGGPRLQRLSIMMLFRSVPISQDNRSEVV